MAGAHFLNATSAVVSPVTAVANNVMAATKCFSRVAAIRSESRRNSFSGGRTRGVGSIGMVSPVSLYLFYIEQESRENDVGPTRSGRRIGAAPPLGIEGVIDVPASDHHEVLTGQTRPDTELRI